jgi:hypothetical protein
LGFYKGKDLKRKLNIGFGQLFVFVWQLNVVVCTFIFLGFGARCIFLHSFLIHFCYNPLPKFVLQWAPLNEITLCPGFSDYKFTITDLTHNSNPLYHWSGVCLNYLNWFILSDYIIRSPIKRCTLYFKIIIFYFKTIDAHWE